MILAPVTTRLFHLSWSLRKGGLQPHTDPLPCHRYPTTVSCSQPPKAAHTSFPQCWSFITPSSWTLFLNRLLSQNLNQKSLLQNFPDSPLPPPAELTTLSQPPSPHAPCVYSYLCPTALSAQGPPPARLWCPRTGVYYLHSPQSGQTLCGILQEGGLLVLDTVVWLMKVCAQSLQRAWRRSSRTCP